jgi:DNA-binding Lrp family transcriptional regulator
VITPQPRLEPPRAGRRRPAFRSPRLRHPAPEDPGTVTAFEEAAAGIRHVLQAQRLFGELNHLLRVAITGLAAFQQLYGRQLARLPGVRRPASALVMTNFIDDRPPPE